MPIRIESKLHSISKSHKIAELWYTLIILFIPSVCVMIILLFYFLHLYHFDATQVMQRNFLRSGKILGTFKLDVATVMSQQGIIPIIYVQQNESIQNNI